MARDGDRNAGELRLWRTACDGDSDARERVVGIVIEIARAYSARLRLPASEVEEIESRMLLSILSLMETRFELRSSLRGWLRFRHLAVTKEYYRDARKKQTMTMLLEDGANIADRGADDGTAPEQHESHELLAQCLAELPESWRHAVRHRFFDDPDAAEFLANKEPSTIRVWVFRGTTALRRCLRKRGVTD